MSIIQRVPRLRPPQSQTHLAPEYFQSSALCFLLNSLEQENLAQNNPGKRLTRVSPDLKPSIEGNGVSCSDTSRAYVDDWSAPVATSNGTGTGDFSVLISGAWNTSASRGLPFHIRNNSSPFHSILSVQNGYYADNGTTGVNESGSVYVGTFINLSGNARGVKVAGAIVNGRRTTILFNRFADTSMELWVNGVLAGTNTATVQDIEPGVVQLVGVGGNAAATGVAMTDPTQLIYVANRCFQSRQAAALTSNPWQIFEPIARRIWVPAAAVGGTFVPAWTNRRARTIGAGVI